MEKQNDQLPDSGQTQIEDLTLNQDRAEEVKAGADQQEYLRITLTDVLVSSYGQTR